MDGLLRNLGVACIILALFVVIVAYYFFERWMESNRIMVARRGGYLIIRKYGRTAKFPVEALRSLDPVEALLFVEVQLKTQFQIELTRKDREAIVKKAGRFLL